MITARASFWDPSSPTTCHFTHQNSGANFPSPLHNTKPRLIPEPKLKHSDHLSDLLHAAMFCLHPVRARQCYQTVQSCWSKSRQNNKSNPTSNDQIIQIWWVLAFFVVIFSLEIQPKKNKISRLNSLPPLIIKSSQGRSQARAPAAAAAASSAEASLSRNLTRTYGFV